MADSPNSPLEALVQTLKAVSRFQFGLRHALYAVAIFGASLGLFGILGIVVAPFVLAIWWQILYKTGQLTLVEVFVIITVSGILALLSVPSGFPARNSHLYGCYDIATALKSYHTQFGSLPPAFVQDSAGQRLHSWRVLILPQLGYQTLYAQYRFDEPWNSPTNARLLQQMPREYACRATNNDATNLTAWQVAVGPTTAWPGSVSGSFDETTDSRAATILAVECEQRLVPWTAPQDLSLDEAVELMTTAPNYPLGYWKQGFVTSSCLGRAVVLAEGWQGISPTNATQLRECLEIADGHPAGANAKLPIEWLEWRWRVWHYGNLLRLGVFIAICLLPITELRQAARSKAVQIPATQTTTLA